MTTQYRKTCDACGAEFVSSRPHAKTCSAACRKRKSRRITDPEIGSLERRQRQRVGIDFVWDQREAVWARRDLAFAGIPMETEVAGSGDVPAPIFPTQHARRSRKLIDHSVTLEMLLEEIPSDSCPAIPMAERPFEWREWNPEVRALKADASELLLKLQGLAGLALCMPSLVNEPDLLRREFGIEADALREMLEVEESLRVILDRFPLKPGLVAYWDRRRSSPEYRAELEKAQAQGEALARLISSLEREPAGISRRRTLLGDSRSHFFTALATSRLPEEV
jgi:hypothetical protein